MKEGVRRSTYLLVVEERERSDGEAETLARDEQETPRVLFPSQSTPHNRFAIANVKLSPVANTA
jgi:hypothetical protein